MLLPRGRSLRNRRKEEEVGGGGKLQAWPLLLVCHTGVESQC